MDFTWVTSDDANAIQNAIVDAKGDLITATAADTPARLAVGSNGDTLVADSSSSVGLRWQGNYAAGKNKIINGDFGIWQRGTSFTPQNSYNADRWVQAFDVAPTSGSITRETFTAGTAPVAGYEGQYFHRTTITTRGSSTYYILGQRIEDVRTFANQTITVSFWARLSAGSVSTCRIRVSQDFGSGGSATVTTDNSYNFTPTGSWTRFSLTIPVPSISGKTIGTSNNLMIDAVVPYSAANTIDFWGWQAEVGNVATAFQTATGTLQGELAAAMRYYQRFGAHSGGTTANYAFYGYGYTQTTTSLRANIELKTRMRVAPTTVEFANLSANNLSNTAYAVSAVTSDSNNNTDTIASVDCTIATSTNNTLHRLVNNNNSGGYIAFSAEL
jgi:hypothetical protein